MDKEVDSQASPQGGRLPLEQPLRAAVHHFLWRLSGIFFNAIWTALLFVFVLTAAQILRPLGQDRRFLGLIFATSELAVVVIIFLVVGAIAKEALNNVSENMPKEVKVAVYAYFWTVTIISGLVVGEFALGN